MPHTHTESTEPTIHPNRRYLCRHVFVDGHRCGSPALREQDLCYNHTRARRSEPCASRTGTFAMPRVDDRASVQLAIYDVLCRIAGGDIEYKRGSILLYGLQIASTNLSRQEKLLADQPPQVEEITSDYHLGDLAPIQEIPAEEPPTTDAATEPRVPHPCEARVGCTDKEIPSGAPHLASEMWDSAASTVLATSPRSSSGLQAAENGHQNKEALASAAPTHTPVILSKKRERDEPNDPETLDPPTPLDTIPPLVPRIHRRRQSGRTSNLEPRTSQLPRKPAVRKQFHVN